MTIARNREGVWTIKRGHMELKCNALGQLPYEFFSLTCAALSTATDAMTRAAAVCLAIEERDRAAGCFC